MLTIAIPTYNRNKILEKNLKLLLPQLTEACSLLILDNSSDIPVSETIEDLIKKYSKVNINVIRNKYNIGMTGNILKCFELCDNSWLWILGDDDQVKEGAIKQILQDILIYKQNHFISYAWDEPSFNRKKDILTSDINQLIDKIESIGVILFISTSIYNIKKVINSISYGSFFQTTYAPHLAILFMSLKDGGHCTLSKKQIVINEGFLTPIQLRWDQLFIYQIIILLRLPLNPLTISKLKRKLVELTRLWTVTHLIYTLSYLKYTGEMDGRPLVLYKDIINSFFYLDQRIGSRIIKILGYLILMYPNFFKPLIEYAFILAKNKKFEINNNLRI